jgi:hypothetical protein
MIEQAGAELFMFSTDYPHPDGHERFGPGSLLCRQSRRPSWSHVGNDPAASRHGRRGDLRFDAVRRLTHGLAECRRRRSGVPPRVVAARASRRHSRLGCAA